MNLLSNNKNLWFMTWTTSQLHQYLSRVKYHYCTFPSTHFPLNIWNSLDMCINCSKIPSWTATWCSWGHCRQSPGRPWLSWGWSAAAPAAPPSSCWPRPPRARGRRRRAAGPGKTTCPHHYPTSASRSPAKLIMISNILYVLWSSQVELYNVKGRGIRIVQIV